jgi:hypothetical protein
VAAGCGGGERYGAVFTSRRDARRYIRVLDKRRAGLELMVEGPSDILRGVKKVVAPDCCMFELRQG